MSTNWLANAHPETFWPHHAWPDFAALSKPEKTRALVILPIHGFADHGLGLPLDAEEAVGSAILRRAAEIATASGATLLVLPPLRFGLAPYPSAHFGIDAETACEQMREIVRSVKASGFGKIVFFNTSPWNEELVATVALDTRVEFGLENHIVNLSKLGMSFHPAAPREARANAQAAAALALGLTAKEVRANVKKSAKLAKPDIRDADFRPGNFQRPQPLAPDETLDAANILKMASIQFARALAGSAGSLPAIDIAYCGQAARAPSFPRSCRSHYLPALTAAELAALPNKRRALVIIPTGAIEQHGPHLPVGVDAILGQAWLAHALPKLLAKTPRAAKRVFIAPPITFGKSNEHDGFPGTITISAKTLRRVLLALAAHLRALGFRAIAVLNTHGGNSPTIVHTLREIQTTLNLRAGMLKPPLTPDLSAKEAALGIHAGEWETALMLACAPELVRQDKAVCEYPALPPDGPANSANLAWLTRDISQSGVLGDARAATPEKGTRWLETASEALAVRIGELLGKDNPPFP